MTPLDLEILLYAGVSAAPFPRRGAPAVEEAIDSFIGLGIIRLGPEPNTLTVTECGQAWLKAILRTPMPQRRQVWVDANGEVLR